MYANMSVHIDVYIWMWVRILNECIHVDILAIRISTAAVDHNGNNNNK